MTIEEEGRANAEVGDGGRGGHVVALEVGGGEAAAGKAMRSWRRRRSGV